MKEYISLQEESDTRARSQQLNAKDELSGFLHSMGWDYMLTVTTRKPWHDAISLNREVYKSLNRSTAVERAFLCTEPYYLRSGVHVHGLVKVDSKYREFVSPSNVWQGLFNRFGRSKVDFVRSHEAVAGYCSKYVTKSSGDYYFHGRTDFWKGD